ncbi:MAG: hypothetical protein KF726_23410 [Anaerolineae bacterium]|nr:hypothetical protein [Anaerolineae bacterium]
MITLFAAVVIGGILTDMLGTTMGDPNINFTLGAIIALIIYVISQTTRRTPRRRF